MEIRNGFREFGGITIGREFEGETPLHCCVLHEYDPLGIVVFGIKFSKLSQ